MGHLDLLKSTFPFLINENEDAHPWARTPILFVPLATLGGSPNTSVRILNVIAEPFPASVLTTPATNPPTTAIIIADTSNY